MLRLLLIIASLAGGSFMAFIFIDEYRNSMWWLTASYCVGLFINAGYLLANPRGGGRPSRIGRLVGLWFDAKEADLKKRIETK